MKKYIRSFASIVIISMFLVLAWSCFYGTDDEKVFPAFDCNFFPTPIIKNQEILLRFIDRKTNKPISNLEILPLFRHYRKINRGVTCELYNEGKEYDFLYTTDNFGIVRIITQTTYFSSEDFLRAYFEVYEEIETYDVNQYHDNSIFLRYDKNSYGKTIYLLKYDVYP